MKKRPGLMLGIVLALIAMLMVKVYLDRQDRIIREQAKRELAERQKRQVSVLVARKDIPKGTAIKSEMLEKKIIPREYVQPQAVGSAQRVEGMVTLAPISEDEQITLTKLLSPQQAMGGSLAMATPVGKRAIAISVDDIFSLMGMIRPGDYVDVMGLIPVPVQTPEGKQVTQTAVMPLFQNVLVLTVGQEIGRLSTSAESRYEKGERAKASPMITLALLPQEANLIAFVQEQGKIRLTLRSPADSRIEPIRPANWETLFQYLMPKQQAEGEQPPEQEIQAQPTRTVEIYRGLNRETVPLSR